MSGATITTCTSSSGDLDNAGIAAPYLALAIEASRPHVGGRVLSLPDGGELILRRGSSESPAGSSESPGVLAFEDSRMSCPHARLFLDETGWMLTDLGSKNGTFVNDVRLEASARRLRHGDIIEVGSTFFVFRVAPDRPPVPGAAVAPFKTLAPHLHARFTELHQIAHSGQSVLIRGETGTGKELTARAVHELSGRRGEFVGVNCGALTESLLEAELFGVKKGAYSGAEEERIGLVRAANGGTLFLDEIAELSESSQVALLRVLQESEVKPVGGSVAVKVDVRFVAATHQDLDQRIRDGGFRRDLYARLSGFVVELPPLQERREDIGLLVAEILRATDAKRADRVRLRRTAARALMLYDWPLNIRELANALRSALILAGDGDEIALNHFPQAIRHRVENAPISQSLPVLEDDLNLRRPQALRRQLERLYKEHRGNVSAVARELGKARAQVQRWNRKLGIDPSVFS